MRFVLSILIVIVSIQTFNAAPADVPQSTGPEPHANTARRRVAASQVPAPAQTQDQAGAATEAEARLLAEAQAQAPQIAAPPAQAQAIQYAGDLQPHHQPQDSNIINTPYESREPMMIPRFVAWTDSPKFVAARDLCMDCLNYLEDDPSIPCSTECCEGVACIACLAGFTYCLSKCFNR